MTARSLVSIIFGVVSAYAFTLLFSYLISSFALPELSLSTELVITTTATLVILLSLLSLRHMSLIQKYLKRTSMVLIVLCLISTVIFNLLTFKQIEQSETYKITAHKSASLTGIIMNMPDTYRGKELFYWLRHNAEHSVLHINMKTLLAIGIAPHRLIGLSHIILVPEKKIGVLKKKPGDLKHYVHFKMDTALNDLWIDTRKLSKGSQLYAVINKNSVFITQLNQLPQERIK